MSKLLPNFLSILLFTMTARLTTAEAPVTASAVDYGYGRITEVAKTIKFVTSQVGSEQFDPRLEARVNFESSTKGTVSATYLIRDTGTAHSVNGHETHGEGRAVNFYAEDKLVHCGGALSCKQGYCKMWQGWPGADEAYTQLRLFQAAQKAHAAPVAADEPAGKWILAKALAAR